MFMRDGDIMHGRGKRVTRRSAEDGAQRGASRFTCHADIAPIATIAPAYYHTLYAAVISPLACRFYAHSAFCRDSAPLPMLRITDGY